MKSTRSLWTLAAVALCLVAGCDDDSDTLPPPTESTVTVNLSNLANPGSGHRYEAWLVVDGEPESIGTFTAEADGSPSEKLLIVDKTIVDAATAFMLTVEPNPDTDPLPSGVTVVAGDFINNSATPTVEHSLALGTSFDAVSGGYILATPTDGLPASNETSGIWFLEPLPNDNRRASLMLPPAPTGWVYEGWVMVGDTALSTGRFTSPSGTDQSSFYSQVDAPAPPFPGEDFLAGAPPGVLFPLQLEGRQVFITLEPANDPYPNRPFVLRALNAVVPSPAASGELYAMENTTHTFPSGTVLREYN